VEEGVMNRLGSAGKHSRDDSRGATLNVRRS